MNHCYEMGRPCGAPDDPSCDGTHRRLVLDEAIGKMWANHGAPNADLAQMPEGTVGAKLLFTTAPVSEVPFLAGAPEWDAYVYADPNDTNPSPTSPRAVMKVRLLQIDIAVKDSRAKETGWIFGTFVYGGGPGGQPGNGWFNVAPVGVMWGNDPGYSGTGPLTQTWLNPEVHMPHVGYQGRLNGPVDNPISSCMSCHATAELPQGTMVTVRSRTPATAKSGRDDSSLMQLPESTFKGIASASCEINSIMNRESTNDQVMTKQ